MMKNSSINVQRKSKSEIFLSMLLSRAIHFFPMEAQNVLAIDESYEKLESRLL
jgi:hypothetical protein